MNKRIRILTAALGISAACMLSMPVFAAWQQDANGYYYMNGNSRVYSNWLRMANSNGGYTYYYINQNGYMVTGWQKLNNVWYYFNADGTMATGWKQIDGAWYYLDPQSGQMKTGWHNQQNNGVTEYYYLKDSGAMATGWRQIDGAWYYFLDDGVCVINLWVQVVFLRHGRQDEDRLAADQQQLVLSGQLGSDADGLAPQQYQQHHVLL